MVLFVLLTGPLLGIIQGCLNLACSGLSKEKIAPSIRFFWNLWIGIPFLIMRWLRGSLFYALGGIPRNMPCEFRQVRQLVG